MQGHYGCGKTTLLRCVAGLTEPDHDRILIGDTDVTQVPTRHRPTGMVVQNYALFPNMTVTDNIAFPLKIRRPWRPLPGPALRRPTELSRLPMVDPLSGTVTIADAPGPARQFLARCF